MPVNSFENYPMSWKPQLSPSKSPLYLALAEKPEQDIANGKLLPGTELEALARKNGVSVYGSERFAIGKEIPSAAVRLAICAPSTQEELEEGLRRLKQILMQL